MNNNRGNNRRRGRGNNRQQGGGQQTNRIDSRARGNAPQLLEKYRKLAHDAHLNGDRVTEEYYLQFADHYFRVLADQRARQEEARQPRADRWQDGGDSAQDRYDSDAGSEYGGENEYQSNPYNYGERREREEAPRYEEREEAAPAEQRGETAVEDGNVAEPAPSVYEPPQNPFTRDNNRGSRGLKPRRSRRESAAAPQDTVGEETASAQLDVAVLPPSIAPREETPSAAPEEAAAPDAAETKPKRRAPRRKAAADDNGEPLKAAS